MNKPITVRVMGERRICEAGLTLSEILRGEKPCGGHGKCGKCRVIAAGALSEYAAAELELLSEEERGAGMRLACLTRAVGDCEILALPDRQQTRIVGDGDLPEMEIKPAFTGAGAALDIGTTTLAARLYDDSGRLLAVASALNPQQRWGADVISRVEAALGGRDGELTGAIRRAVDGLLTELAEKTGIPSDGIGRAVITGNTVMLSLLAGESAEPFSHAPFAPKRLFGETVTAGELGLCALAKETPVFLPPCISAFIGADTVCAILASPLSDKEPAMLADIGTNGEMALMHRGRLCVCSTAAGPAFEGVGISMGMRGAAGAIDRVAVTDGRMMARVIGGGDPTGICGSGLVDAAACMLELGILDESGYLEEDECVIREPVSLTAGDIRMLQLAKSAIGAGITVLMKQEGLTAQELSALYVAGGFGSYLNPESAAKIGLLPRALAAKTAAIGNAALVGASMILLNADRETTAAGIAGSAEVIELSSNPDFSEQFMAGMMLEEI